jgi:hypothetical protein
MTVIDTQTGPAARAVTRSAVAVRGGAIDDVRIVSGAEVVAHTVVRGGSPATTVYPGVLPLAAARGAVAALVDHNRGHGWHVELREVAALRLFGPLANGDLLTTSVKCHQGEPLSNEVVAVARCSRAGTPIAGVTMRLAVVADVPSAGRGAL